VTFETVTYARKIRHCLQNVVQYFQLNVGEEVPTISADQNQGRAKRLNRRCGTKRGIPGRTLDLIVSPSPCFLQSGVALGGDQLLVFGKRR
jgi:hypothetical protein